MSEQPIYKNIEPKIKKVSTYKPQCPICLEILSGFNSMILPYKCRCGIWRMNEDDTFNIEPYSPED